MENLAQKPCKFFSKGDGKCPFKNGCDFSHLLKSGERYFYPEKKKNGPAKA
jgi:hypothetical protein